jgi:pilus assembly protein CpaE
MKKSEISLEDAEAGIGNELYWAIPNDFGTTMEAINNGKPLLDIAPKARVTKNIFNLANSLSVPKDEKPKKKWSLFKK